MPTRTLTLTVDPPPFCVDCVHMLPHIAGPTYAKCRLFTKYTTRAATEYMVTGKFVADDTENYYYCTTARDSDSMCGRNGTRFTPLNNTET